MLYDYAQKVFQEGVPEKAEEAYGHILASYPDFPGKDKALFGLARSFEAKENFRKAVETYDRIIQEFQNRPLAAQALFNKAMLLKDHLFDFTEAERTFQTLLEHYPSTREGQEGQLELADCLIARGDLDRAETIVRRALEHSPKNKGSLWIRTLVRLADVLFLSERYEEVVSQLDVLSNTALGPDLLQDPAVNDGLKLLFFIEEQARCSPEELHYYTRSELLKRQRRYKDALMVLDSLICRQPGTTLTPYGLFQKGKIEMLQGNYRESLAPFDSLQALFPTSLLADQALERMGWIYERTGKKHLALNQYERLLAEYPQSLLADEIRARILRMEKEGS
jgi:tetratricopeptide (TPR) repeat protein